MSNFAIIAFTSIFLAVDPIGVVPAYLLMTRRDDSSPPKNGQTARKAALTAGAVLVVFASVGPQLLDWFGISLPAFQIAGGIVLMMVSLEMLRARRPTKEGPGELDEGLAKEDVAVTPLGVPMLAGPASMTTVAVLTSQAQSWQQHLVVYSAILVTVALTYVVLRVAESLSKLLGRTGIQVLTRIFGLILLAIAVQFLLDGLHGAAQGGRLLSLLCQQGTSV